MHRPICRDRPPVLLMVVLAGVLAGTPTPSPAGPERDGRAMATLQRTADLLSQAQRLSVTAEISFDVVQESGAKREFGETRQIVIRRPDRARIDITKRDGATSGFIVDGQAIAVFNAKEHVYATAARPGTLDEAIDYFINGLDMRFPLAELFSSELAEALRETGRIASYVEPATIAGVPCDHLAFRGDLADMQLWVARGDQPLPSRIVMTYTDAAGQPQFRAQFSGWHLAPDVPDALFVFTPPAGAAKIAFAARESVPTTPGERR
jgi:hypothetical protein